MKTLFFFVLLTLSSGVVLAQSSSRFSITRGVIASGGAISTSTGRFHLDSAIAQPIAVSQSGSRFSIHPGFWIWPSQNIFAPAKIGNNFQLSFQTELGKTYTLQYIGSLSGLNWQNLPSIQGDGTVKTVIDFAPNSPQRFYRFIQE